MRKACFICSFFLCSIYQASAQTQTIKNFILPATYYPIQLYNIVQDANGMMWLATSKGLFTFNGTEFTLQNASQDSMAIGITVLAADSEKLWIGYENGKVAWRSLRLWEDEITLDTIFQSRITSLIPRDSLQAVATYGHGIFFRSKKGTTHISSFNGLPYDEVYCLVWDKINSYWAGTDGGITQIYSSPIQATRTITESDGLPDNIVRQLNCDSDGNLWIGMNSFGVCRFQTTDNKFYQFPICRQWKYGPVTSFATDFTNRLIIGTQNSGLVSIVLCEPEVPSLINEQQGYDFARITQLHCDDEGNVWALSSKRGLDLLPALFEWVQPVGKEDMTDLTAVLNDSNHSTWYANAEGLFRIEQDSLGNKKWLHEKFSTRIQPLITSLFEDESGRIWAGTFNQGVFCRWPGKTSFVNYREEDGLINNNVLGISGKGGRIWFSTFGGVSEWNENSTGRRFLNYADTSNLHSNYIYQTFIDSRGNAWFASDGNGLVKLENGNFEKFTGNSTYSFRTVYSITEDRNGNIWFSTPANGLFRFDGKNFENFNETNGLQEVSISGIAADGNGDILIVQSGGVQVFEVATGQIRSYFEKPMFENIDPNLNAFHIEPSGIIYLATRKGILRYMSQGESFRHEARMRISEVQVNLRAVDFMTENVFPHQQNSFTFLFESYWFSNPGLVKYRYLLKGYEEQWNESKENRAVYSALPAGEYEFQVQSTIHLTFEDAPVQSYKFVIQPPFYSSWWFLSLATAVSILLFYGFIRWRENEIKRKQQLKREKIEFQLENLKAQINPHFLFNSFNTLITLIEEDSHQAVTYVEKLSDFYRSLLSYRDVELIPLKEEINLSKNYIFLLQHRHGDNLVVSYSLDLPVEEYVIPPLTLQMLIENAVKHNVVSKANPLHVFIGNTKFNELYVTNNLQLRSGDLPSTRFGLQSINARFELASNKPIVVVQTDTEFTVKLPLIKKSVI